MQKRLLTRGEAAQFFHVSLSTLDRTRRKGLIPEVILGDRTVRFDPDLLREYARARWPRAAKTAGGDAR